MRKALLFCLILTSQLVLADELPYWVKELPLGIETVYGLGSAQIRGDKAEATAQASERAKIELLMSLQTTVDGQLDTHSKSEMAYRGQDNSFFDQQNTVEQKSRFTVNVQELPGLQISKTHLDTDTGIIYALAELDLQQVNASINNQQQALQQGIKHLAAASTSSFHTLKQLNTQQNNLHTLLQLSQVFSAHLSSASLEKNQQLQQQLQQQQQAIRQQLRFAWHSNNSADNERHQAAIKRIITDLGLIWSPNDANFYVLMQTESDSQYNTQYKTTSIHSQVELSLLDQQGQVVKSDQFSAKGVSAGKYVAPAQRQLDQQIQQLSKQSFQRWLDI